MKKNSALIISLFLLLLGCGKKQAYTVTSLSDLKSARIATLLGSTQDLYVTGHFPKATHSRLETESDMFVALDNGKVDAILIDDQFYKITAESSGKYRNLGTIYTSDLGIGFNLSQTELRDSFNIFLSKMQKDGSYDQLVEKWLGKNHESAGIPDSDDSPKGKPLKVGYTAATQGFGYIKDGKPAGLDVELLTLFGHSIGRPVEFLPINFGGLIAALSSNNVDIIAASISITAERSKQVAFSIPYFQSRTIAVALNQAAAGNSEHGDFKTMDAVKDKRSPGLVGLPKEDVRDSAGIALNKKDTVLLRQINEVMLRFKKDGTLKDIIDRWIKPDGSDYQPEDVPSVKQGNPLRVGIAANREPMCFILNGKIAGVDAELIERIAYELGRPVAYSDMKFSALIASLESQKVDMVISNFSATPELLKRVNFSESYYVNPLVLSTLSPNASSNKPASNLFSKIKDSFISNLIKEKRYLLILDGLKQTVIITFFSVLLGTIFGGLICFLRMSRNKLSVEFAKAYINLMRGTPILVLLMILFYVVFASTGLSATVVAVITFALNMGAYSSEMFRTSIQSVDKGQTEAGTALGFTKIQTFIYVVFPQALKNVIPVYKGEVISLLKNTSIVGYIAVVDLTKASDLIRSRTFDAFFPLIVVAVIYFLLAWLLGTALDKLNFNTSVMK